MIASEKVTLVTIVTDTEVLAEIKEKKIELQSTDVIT